VSEASTADWIQALASVLTLLTALVAIVIAWRVPKLAAKFAEDYRRQHSAADEMQKLQFQFFLQLMAHRAEIAHPLARQAVNAVDVIFAGSPEVRNARKLFMSAVLEQPSNPTVIVERYHSLIEAVARAVGVSQVIGPWTSEWDITLRPPTSSTLLPLLTLRKGWPVTKRLSPRPQGLTN
jgi:histone H3/H4